MQQVIPWVHQSRRRKRHLDGFSRFFQGSLGDRPTDRPRYSVGNNRRSAQWRLDKPNSVIVYGYNKYLLEQLT